MRLDSCEQPGPFPVDALRSVEVAVPDPSEAADFYTQIWGLSEAGRDGDTIWLRARGSDPYVLRLTRGPLAVVSTTFRASLDADMIELRSRLIAAGATSADGIRGIGDVGGGNAFSVRDGAGRLVRVVQGDDRPEVLTCAGSRPTRLAHVNINSADIERDIRFFEAGLGFRLTDRSAGMAFLRTNADHHSIVLARAAVETLNHIAFNHDTWEDVMKASGRMCGAGFTIGWGPGRHGPGNNVFVYFVAPHGVVVEHTAEVLQIDDGYRVGGPGDWVWPEGRTDQWGIAPPKSEACKAAQVAVPFI